MITQRITALVLMLALVLSLLTGCGGEDAPQTTQSGYDESTVTETERQETEAEAQIEPATQTIEHIDPIFSAEGGIYADSLKLTLSLPDGAASTLKIRYTTDGNEPDKGSPEYTAPITLLASRSSVVVRAACFTTRGGLIGHIVTNTYVKDTDGRFEGMMLVAVTSDSENLYGSTGIADNPTMSGKEWERPAHIEIVNENGERVAAQDGGVRIFGGSSRVLSQKSFRLVARNDGYYDELKYNGKGSFAYELFEGREILDGPAAGDTLLKYDRFILRNGGNDSMQSTAADPLRMNLLRDNVANRFCAEVAPDVTIQASRMAVVFLNGAYYGLLDMKEDVNDNYIRNVYGLETKENIAVVKSELDTSRHCETHSNGASCRFCNVWFFYEMDEGDESELEAFTALCEKAIGASAAERGDVYREVAQKIDMDSFIAYMAFNLYVCNTDWPHNNVRFWRYTGDEIEGIAITDGKWRFSLRDMDFSFGRYQSLVLPEIYSLADTDTFRHALGNYWDGEYAYTMGSGLYPDSLCLQGLLDFCLRNAEFKASFEAYCRELATEENADLLEEIMDECAESVSVEIPYHIEKWKGTIAGAYTYENWREQVEAMKQWAQERNAYFLGYLDEMLLRY